MTSETLRQAALAWAARGFRVFRMRPRGKAPAFKGWIDEATDNLDVVRSLWTNAATNDAEQWNVGVLTNDLVLVDVDVKHIGRVEAEMNLLDLGLDLTTLTIRTPSGGWHLYHRGPTVKSSAGKLAPGIDIRSYNSYALAPGSVTDVGRYAIEHDGPVLDAPDHLIARCGGPRAETPERATLPDIGKVTAAPEDQALARQQFDHMLARLRDAVPGTRNGTLNDVAFQTFALVRAGRLPLAEAEGELRETAEEIGLEAEEIEATIGSAYRGSSGASVPPSVAELAAGLDLPATTATSRIRFFGDDDAALKVDWLVKGLIPKEGVGLLAGQSRVGKSFLSLDLAGALATGGTWFGRAIRERVGTLIIAAEGFGTVAPRLEAMRLGKLTSVDRNSLPIAWTDLDVQTNLAVLLAQAKGDFEARGVRLGLVIVDTISAAFRVQDNNSVSEAYAALTTLERACRSIGAFGLGIAHFGKDAASGVVGSHGWTAAADVILAATGATDEANGTVRDRKFALTKSRYGETGPISAFDLRSQPIGQDADGDPVSSAFVAQVEQPKVAAKAQLSVPGESFIQALTYALEHAGETKVIDGIEIRAAPQYAVQERFEAIHHVNSGNPAEALRKAFSRGYDNARACGLVNMRALDPGELVGNVYWLSGGISAHAGQKFVN